MSKYNKATPKQIAFLEKCGIAPPPTKVSCSSLIAFIIYGNATIGKNMPHRINLVKVNQQKWINKQINQMNMKGETSRQGKILYLLARRKGDVFHNKKIGRLLNWSPNNYGAFVACVQWKDGKKTIVNMGKLKLIK